MMSFTMAMNIDNDMALGFGARYIWGQAVEMNFYYPDPLIDEYDANTAHGKIPFDPLSKDVKKAFSKSKAIGNSIFVASACP